MSKPKAVVPTRGEEPEFEDADSVLVPPDIARWNTSHKTSVGSWCLYDWANTSFGTLITTFIFAPYFVTQVAESRTEGTVVWGHTASVVALTVALTSPVLGAVADKIGHRKRWLMAFTALCALFACALYLVQPDSSFLYYALFMFACGAIASDLSLVFYNSMLPDLVPHQILGRVSGWGWSLGYFGGIFCLLLAFALFADENAPLQVLDTGEFEPIRATTILAAAWYVAFALPLFFFTPEKKTAPVAVGQAVIAGLKTLGDTFRRFRDYAQIVRFLLAFLFYSNGFATLYAFGGIYAAGTFEMDADELILFGVLLNIAAGLGAFGFGWIDDRIGSKRTILMALSGLIIFGLVLVLIESQAALWFLGFAVGFFLGPAQAASRTFMARLAPPDMRTEMFGLFAMSGKATAFLGPLVLASVTQALDSQRAGMATIIVFFALGAFFLLPIQELSDAPDDLHQ